MAFIDWAAAAILGALLIFSGTRTIRYRLADVPERYAGDSAVRLSWLWLVVSLRRRIQYRAVEAPVPPVSRSRRL